MPERPIPEGPIDLTPDWLTGVLRDAGAIDAERVVHVATQVIGEDRGFTGVVARLQLDYDDAGTSAPRTMVAKFPLGERAVASGYRESQAAGAHLSPAYIERCAREVSFYQKVAPEAAFAPRAYFAGAEPDSGRVALLIEDLSGGEEGDALRGCTVEQAQLVVELIAGFHARWWERPELSRFGWLPRWAVDPAGRAEQYRARTSPFLESYGHRIPRAVANLIVALRDGYEAVLRKLNGPPATMIHADLHLDNIMFMSSGQPPVKVLDWQSVARGSGAVDLATFVAGSLDVASRREAELTLLHRYHQILTASGVSGYTFNDLLADYRCALLWQLAGTVGWLSRTSPDTLAGRERQLVESIFTKGQLFAALEDHEPHLSALLRTLHRKP